MEPKARLAQLRERIAANPDKYPPYTKSKGGLTLNKNKAIWLLSFLLSFLLMVAISMGGSH